MHLGLQPTSNGLQPASNGLHPSSDGLQYAGKSEESLTCTKPYKTNLLDRQPGSGISADLAGVSN